jgi:exopolysaccharide biosynthesis polyprenyl glycosylphosphotransferase
VLIAYGGAFGVRAAFALPLTAGVLASPGHLVWHSALGFALATQVPLLYFFGLYDARHLRRGAHAVLSPAGALAIQLLGITAWCFFRGDLGFPRSVLVLFTAANVALVAASRALYLRAVERNDVAARLVLVGSPGEVEEFRQTLHEADPEGAHFAVVGSVPLNGSARPGHELARFAVGADVDRVILVGAESWKDELIGGMLAAAPGASRPEVAVVPSVYDLFVGRIASLSIEDVPLIEVARGPRDDIAFAFKGALDCVLASVLLAALLPVLGAAALAIRLSSPGSVLYRQRRVGKGGREFIMYKLRTMREGAEETTGPVLAQPSDRRVTLVGRWLRMTRIDEIPQLLNVLNGTMSLIGPRPERPEFAERFRREIPGYAERWSVKPGLSGLAQVRGEYHTSARYKLKYDLAYIYNYSLLLDFRIMAETVKVLVTRRGV